MSLVLRDSTMPTTVLVGDAVKNLAELASGKVAMSWNNDLSAQSIMKVRSLAKVVVPGHDRMLQVCPDKIVAAGAAYERILLPPGVSGDGAAFLELKIEPSSLAIS
jgi:hypothetical protein